jgi:hypothetical protein
VRGDPLQPLRVEPQLLGLRVHLELCHGTDSTGG